MDVTQIRFVGGIATLEFNVQPVRVLKGFNPGTAALDAIFLNEHPFDGARSASSRRDITAIELGIVIDPQDTYEDLKAIHDALAVELELARNVIELVPRTATASEFIDTFRAPVPPLYDPEIPDGELHKHKVKLLLHIPCQPNPRLAPVVIDEVTISNALNDRHLVVVNPGNHDSEMILVQTPGAGKVGAIRGGIRSTGDQEEFRAGYMAPLANATLKTDTAATTVTGAMGMGAQAGKAAVVDFDDQETMASRIEDEWAVADPTAIEGLFRLKLRIQHIEVTSDRSRFAIKPYYGFSSTEIAMEECPRRVVDLRDVVDDDWTEIDFGLIKVDPGADRIILDVFAERLEGDGKLAIDTRMYEPAGEHNWIAGVPNFRQGTFGREVFEADELDGTGRLFRHTYRLNADGEYARTFPSAGFAQVAGIHTVEFDVSLREPDDPDITSGANPLEAVIAEVQVWRDTGGGFGGTPWKKLKLRCRKNQLWTRLRRKLTYSVSATDVTAGYKYRYQVEQTASTLDGRRAQVHQMAHEMIPALTVDTDLVLDSFAEREFVESSSVTTFEAMLESGPILLPPGESTIVLTTIDLPIDPGYMDIDENEALGIVDAARELIVSGTVFPRKIR